MSRGFYLIIAAQFLSSLADNALLIAAIAMLHDASAPEWMTPLLKLFFTVSYVLLAPFVGAFADSFPKGRVMLIANFVKLLGCVLMVASWHPLWAYAVAGFGAAAYSPAKYGILTEMLPPADLVRANGWLEGSTVTSIILGAVVGGALISPGVSASLLAVDISWLDTGIDTPGEVAVVITALIYLLAGLLNLGIPDTGARYPKQLIHPIRLIRAFIRANKILWTDHIGQISLAITTLFWGAGATLQFIVLDWARESLGMPLSRAAILQGVVAIGIAFGAVLAARIVRLESAMRVLPVGIALGLVVPSMTLVHSAALAYPLLVLIGALAGFFVVPMNAVLQNRGYVRLSAGHSIAVQNFNENLNILLMLGLYALLLHAKVGVTLVILLFGGSIAVLTALVIVRYRHNRDRHGADRLIGEIRADRQDA
ncbi:MAG: lysophospholipid transporter LplT [Burkholderiaceae bacterium]